MNESEKVRESIQFQAKDAKIEKTEDDLTKITVPISSTNVDRDEERIDEEGLKAITAQIVEENVPMFPDHGIGDSPAMYSFMDIMGRWEDAEITEENIAEASAVLEQNNKYAERLKELLEQDMPVGFSIGFSYDEEDVKKEDGETNVYQDMDLMEISPVGIPSNPDARVNFAQTIAKTLQEENVDLKEAIDKFTKAIKEEEEDEEEDENGEESEEENGEEEEEESKQEFDVSPTIIADEVADHFDVEVSEIMEVLDEDSFDFDARARASATADIVGTDTGTILEMYDSLANGSEEEESIMSGVNIIADALDVESEEVLRAIIAKFDSFEECVDHMLEQGYDQESAENICGDICNESDEPDESENEDLKQLVNDLQEESDELKEEIESLKEEKEELARELKKSKAQNRDSERKGIDPAEKDNEPKEDSNKNKQKTSFSDLTEEAVIFGEED